jgi:hypothetical protein
MKSFSLDGLNVEELDQLINEAQARKEVLGKQEKEKDWEDFRKALYKYIDKWGRIDIEDDYEVIAALEDDMDTNEISSIKVQV